MHYKNGRPAKNGDKVLLIPSYGPPVSGILYDATPGNDYCNGRIAVTRANDPCPNLKEVLHIDDVIAADKAGRIPDETAPAREAARQAEAASNAPSAADPNTLTA